MSLIILDNPTHPLTPSTNVAFGGNVLMVTLGCAKNLVDSEVMLGALTSRGFKATQTPTEADLIVVNTCAFLQSAVEEGIDRILEMSEYKKNGRCRRLIVAGCMVERYREQLKAEMPEVDLFISTDELQKVADLSATTAECLDLARRPYFLYDGTAPRVYSTGGHSIYVKIAEGCDRPCAFCIIPKIRGEFRSRPIESVINEITRATDEGKREINLIAQDLTSYGVDFSTSPKKPKLTELLQAINKIEGNFWTRLLYAYPIGVDERLLRTIVESEKICNYLDIPLQHISHNMLKAMLRPLGARGTRSLVEHIREIAPEIAIRTTMVVGFPGETEADIRELEEFVSEGHFTHLGVFTYSHEPESTAYVLDDSLPQQEKEDRKARIMAAQQKVVERSHEDLVDSKFRVLIDGYHEETEMLYSARSEWQAPETDTSVIINELEDGIDVNKIFGKFGEVEIVDVAGYDLIGRLISIEE